MTTRWQACLIRLFTWFWRAWLFDGDRVIRVKNWNTALVETRNGRRVNCSFRFNGGIWWRGEGPGPR